MDLSLASKVRSVTHGYRRLVNMVICMSLGSLEDGSKDTLLRYTLQTCCHVHCTKMRHDPVTNVMATVIPCRKAQAELVKQFHLEHDSHPHYRQQLYTMRQVCWWQSMAIDIRELASAGWETCAAREMCCVICVKL